MIRLAKYHEKKIVIDILTKAFDTNNSVNYVVKNDSKRVKRIKYLMDYSFEICWHYGQIYISEDKTAVALMMKSSDKKTTLRTVWLDMKLAVISIGLKRVSKVLEREAYLKQFRPKEDYLYFWYFGVHPDHRGNGAAKALKNRIFNFSKEINLPILVETSIEKNKRIYERYGFEVYHTWFTDNKFNTYFMRRA